MQVERYARHGEQLLEVLTDAIARVERHQAGAPEMPSACRVLRFDDGGWSVTWTNGKTLPSAHRLDGPAIVSFEVDGVLRLEWYYSGLPHRDGGGPALVEYDHAGIITCEEWWTYGELTARRAAAELD
ncbi:hypothetical protein [Demequina maris]|uniref:hypothetical protein n=1 Tax=Demequina maris TaxID=1638982 RepID=UPI000781D1BE|nr:hypothetical protein [Demequina maris]